MIGDNHKVSESFLLELLSLGLAADDLEDAIRRKRDTRLEEHGIYSKIPVREAFDVFMQSLGVANGRRRAYSQTSVAVYKQVLRDYYKYCMKTDRELEVRDVGKYVIAFLLDTNEEKGFQPTTWNKYAAVLRAFLRSTSEHYQIRRAHMPKFEPLTRDVPQALTEDEVCQLLDIARGANYALRSLFMVSFFLDTGVRRDEFRRLQLGHIDFAESTMLIQGKGARKRIVVIPPHLLSFARTYFDAYGICKPNHYIYGQLGDPSRCVSNNTLDDTMRRLLRKLPSYNAEDKRHRYHLHTLRHTYAVRMLRAKVSLRTIAQVLGHQSVRTTQIYTVLDTANLREELQSGFDVMSRWWRNLP